MDADELLRDAQYALLNISHGSADSKKHAAKAESLARRIIRRYPDSVEVASAHVILEQLGQRVPTPKKQFQHFHATPAQEHQPQSLPATRVAKSNPAQNPNPNLWPGWPRRLAQAIPVVVGIYLIWINVATISFPLSYTALSAFWFLFAGGLLVTFPWTTGFNKFVNHAKTTVFVNEDWSDRNDHWPKQKDVEALVRALSSGNKSKLVVLVFVLFLLSRAFVVVAAVVYVVGIKQAFVLFEKWSSR